MVVISSIPGSGSAKSRMLLFNGRDEQHPKEGQINLEIFTDISPGMDNRIRITISVNWIKSLIWKLSTMNDYRRKTDSTIVEA